MFKIIRDHFEPPKEADRQEVKEKYLLVKYHDRVGRLADTLEYSHVPFPLDRVDEELIEELHRQAASSIEITGNELVVKHLYIERRMIPLNEYLNEMPEKECHHAIDEYGKAIRDLAGANIFPGDMMLKNFGVTGGNRVVFYDYDEICYMTDCNFRRIPTGLAVEDEMMALPSYSVESGDVFPEEFASFFFSKDEHRREFYQNHQDLVDPKFWRERKERILAGHHEDILPYPTATRFAKRYPGVSGLLSKDAN